jgi:hypothetical protein
MNLPVDECLFGKDLMHHEVFLQLWTRGLRLLHLLLGLVGVVVVVELECKLLRRAAALYSNAEKPRFAAALLSASVAAAVAVD